VWLTPHPRDFQPEGQRERERELKKTSHSIKGKKAYNKRNNFTFYPHAIEQHIDIDTQLHLLRERQGSCVVLDNDS